jgi:hypothetical protein
LGNLCSYPHWVQALPIAAILFVCIRFFGEEEYEAEKYAWPTAAVGYVIAWVAMSYSGKCLF